MLLRFSRYSCFLLLLLGVMSVVAQESAISLLPYTDATFGLKTVIPEGWKVVGNGIIARQKDAVDQTVIALQAAPLKPEMLLNTLMAQLRLSAVPPSTGTLTTAAFTWTLYQADVTFPQATIRVGWGLTEQAGKTYIALLQTPAEEYDALYVSVFMPLLEAYAPLNAASVATPYTAEEVTFTNGDITLAGTLTLPTGTAPFAAVVLVSGSGPHDRDESLAPVAPIKPLALIADALTRAGVAVLRYDDRGAGQSTGDFNAATTADFATDAEAAVRYLASRAEIDPQRIGMLGHSEGGLVTAMLAGKAASPLAFAVLLAGPAVNGADVLRLQTQRALAAAGVAEADIRQQLALQEQTFALIAQDDRAGFLRLAADQAQVQLAKLSQSDRDALGDLETYINTVVNQQAASYFSPWFKYFLTYNPADALAHVQQPVLAVYGTLDVQVDAKQNQTALERVLQQAGNTQYQITVLPGANHLFQSAKTGALSEYASLGDQFTPELLPLLTEWIVAHA